MAGIHPSDVSLEHSGVGLSFAYRLSVLIPFSSFVLDCLFLARAWAEGKRRSTTTRLQQSLEVVGDHGIEKEKTLRFHGVVVRH